jgi:tRNA-2-methylthio-N6-dimethylallyladenosine synthase
VAGAPAAVKKTKGAAAHAAWAEDNGDKKILLGIPTLAALKSL